MRIFFDTANVEENRKVARLGVDVIRSGDGGEGTV